MATDRVVQLGKFVFPPQAIVSFRRGATQLDGTVFYHKPRS